MKVTDRAIYCIEAVSLEIIRLRINYIKYWTKIINRWKPQHTQGDKRTNELWPMPRIYNCWLSFTCSGEFKSSIQATADRLGITASSLMRLLLENSMEEFSKNPMFLFKGGNISKKGAWKYERRIILHTQGEGRWNLPRSKSTSNSLDIHQTQGIWHTRSPVNAWQSLVVQI